MKTNQFLEKQRKEPHAIRIGKKNKDKTPKSNHKHTYADCLLTAIEKHPTNSNQAVERCYRAKYCTICGKIADIQLFESEPKEIMIMGNLRTVNQMITLSVKEMQERYQGYKTFAIKDIWKDKFVTLE